jgi:hypothetical protein
MQAFKEKNSTIHRGVIIMATVNDAIHVCDIAARFLEGIAEGTKDGEYDCEPFPHFEEFARDFIAWDENREDEEDMVARIAPLLTKITQKLFDEF